MLGGAGVVIYKHTPSLSVRSFWLPHRVVMITSELRKFNCGVRGRLCYQNGDRAGIRCIEWSRDPRTKKCI